MGWQVWWLSLSSTLRGINSKRYKWRVNNKKDEKTGLRPFGKLRMSITLPISIAVAIGACKAYPHAERKMFFFFFILTYRMKRKCFSTIFGVVGARRGARTRNFSRRDVSRAGPAGTPKTPVFGLPKSRPSPLQKTPFFALSEAKSVQFRPICARKCTFLTPFLRT
jgi:hypothetical protein